jgi:hypothetical protein
MKGAKHEPAGRKVSVDLAHSERQHRALPAPVLKPLYALAQLGQYESAPGIRHALPQQVPVL